MKKPNLKFSLQLHLWQWISIHSKMLHTITVAVIMIMMLTTTVLASTAAPAATETVWTRARAIMQDVYAQIILISTIAAVVTAAVALLLMNFSKNSRTVDESRSWLKRIIISWAILNGLGFIMASGIDIAYPRGTPIYAAKSGVVVTAEKRTTGYGNRVVINHGGGYATLYAHCYELLVSVGDAVSAGDIIATVGSTGRSTGNHLHFEIISGGTVQNPRDYIGW